MATEGVQRRRLTELTLVRLLQHLQSKGTTDEDSFMVYQVVRTHLEQASDLHLLATCMQVLPSELREETIQDATDSFGCRARNDADPTIALRTAISDVRKLFPVRQPRSPLPAGFQAAGPPPPEPADPWPMELLQSTLVAPQQIADFSVGTPREREVEGSRSFGSETSGPETAAM
jgi:hypothetical protein